jgi:hypothetical protein
VAFSSENRPRPVNAIYHLSWRYSRECGKLTPAYGLRPGSGNGTSFPLGGFGPSGTGIVALG